MNTNVLLIIIIVLMSLGLLLQLLNLAAIYFLPENFIRSFLDDDETEEDEIVRKVLDVEAKIDSRGFGKPKKSKSSRWNTVNKKTKKSTNIGENVSNSGDLEPSVE